MFLPDSGHVEGKVNELKTEFGFVESILATINLMSAELGASMASDDPPVIKVDLSEANSKYDYGGEAIALDFSWYAPYKPLVDDILSTIIWGFFIWRLFMALPGIINGMQGVSENVDTARYVMWQFRHRK